MKLSEDKISHLSHMLKNGILANHLGEIPDAGDFLRITKNTLSQYNKIEDEVDDIARKKIQTYKRNILEGSREWDVMYRKIFEEEIKKKW